LLRFALSAPAYSTLSPTDPVPRGLLTLCPWASSGPQGLHTAYIQPIYTGSVGDSVGEGHHRPQKLTERTHKDTTQDTSKHTYKHAYNHTEKHTEKHTYEHT
jgi:hypothetical protein